MDKKEYNVGLDIGTSSIGYAVVDDNYKLMHVKGKYGYGVSIFKEGQPAADRRSFRTTRRRLNRRKWRLGFLREIFEPYIAEVDESFFMRQKQSNLFDKDPKKQFSGSILFNDQLDKDFYEQYPTIYHLRKAIIEHPEKQFDIREIYLAIHHIVKYRGHFLNSASVSSFKSGQIDFASKFQDLNEKYASIYPELGFELAVDKANDVKAVLLNNDKSRSDRKKNAAEIIFVKSEDTDKGKLQDKIAKEILNAVLGMKTKFNVIANVDSDDGKWNFTLDAEDSDEKLDLLLGELTDDSTDVLNELNEIHSAIILAGIVPEGKGLSESMVEKYETHKQDLKDLKELAAKLDAKNGNKLTEAYNKYIDGVGSKQFTQDEFYKEVQSAISKSDDPLATKINESIVLDNFMPKQRTKANGAIPHQLHQRELREIIESQKQYYPWLGEKVGKEYKLEKLVSFRVDYYVGPMVDTSGAEQTKETSFAWMVRANPQSTERITPWNYEQLVDKDASAENFIKRMTTKDTYLLNEDVLPKNSLLYQDFEVYNELNNVRVNGDKLTTELKQQVHDELFTQHASVSLKKFRECLIAKAAYAKDDIDIRGLADEKKFLSSLSTYFDYAKIIPDQLDNNQYRSDIERIIEWSTIFEDAGIFKRKLDTIDWLNDDQRNKLAAKRYRGWGNLSRRLLAGLVDENGERIIDRLRNGSDNFMVVVKEPAFQEAIVEENSQLLNSGDKDVSAVIDELYTSPQNKKAIRKVMLVVEDIQRAMGGVAPKKIFIEFARDDEQNPQRTNSRLSTLRNTYKHISDEILADKSVRKELDSKSVRDLQNDRLMLYFLQGGIDVYTGKSINIDELSHYDIDHILPQSYVKDDSLNNRVLVSAKMNRNKNDTVPNDFTNVHFDTSIHALWHRMVDEGLMTKAKFSNLTLNPDNVNKFKIAGFVNRQLVETRQIIKLVANLLNNQFDNDDTEIVSVKANLTHDMRETFDFPKNRDVNNYHHAFDAYLAAFVGTYLYRKYPKLRPFFVYGQFKKGNLDKLRNFDFLSALKNQDKVIDKKTGELIVDKEQVLADMDKMYGFKKVTVAHEVNSGYGAMYDQTLYKASEDQASGRGSKKLIPKKFDKPTELYGGYTGSKDAFMSIVRLKKKNEIYYKVVGIPVRVADQIEVNRKVDLEKLNNYLRDNVYTTVKTNKKGETTSKTEWFEVVLPKVYFGQKVIDGGQPFMLGSSTLPYNLIELSLSKDAIKKINHNKNSDFSLQQVYEEILISVNKYFPLYDTNKFRVKLTDAHDKFFDLPEKSQFDGGKLVQIGQAEIISRILQGLHANATTTNLKDLNIATPFGFMQQPSGVKLSKNAKLVFESTSGIFSRIISFSDL